jgi:hypothetical protein
MTAVLKARELLPKTRHVIENKKLALKFKSLLGFMSSKVFLFKISSLQESFAD